MLGAGAESVQPGVDGVNCYEWRKHITGSVAVQFTYNETGPGYTLAGSGTITHGALYTGWTRRELQCEGMPLGTEDTWILRGPNLCQGRALLNGILTATNTIPVTYTPTTGPATTEDWAIFWQITANDYAVVPGVLMPVSPYPDWEDDPYSVAYRAQIDGLPVGTLYVGIASVPPSPGAPYPSAVPLQWLKDGQTGTSSDGFLEATVTCNFSLI